MATHLRDPRLERIDTAAWGGTLLWVGVFWLADLGAGVALLGFAAIVLAAQLARRAIGVAADPFWSFAGACLAVGGLWILLGIRADLVPVLFLLAGGLVLFSALRRRRRVAG